MKVFTRSPSLRELKYLLAQSLLVSLCACTTFPSTDFQSAEVPLEKQELSNLTIREPSDLPAEGRQEDLYKVLVAEIAGHRGKVQIAVDNYLQLARKSSDPAYAERATRIAVFARQDPEALEAAQIWSSLLPDDIEPRQVLTAMYIRTQQPEQARLELEKILATPGGNSGERLRMIANFLGREQDKEMALSVMEGLVKDRQQDADALFAYALLAVRAEKTDKARTAMEKALKVAPMNLNMAMAYLGILQKQGDTKYALEWLKAILTAYPDTRDLRMIYARLLADTRDYPAARIEFQILERLEPDNIDVQYALGLLNLQLDNVAAARVNFERLLVLEGRLNEARYYLGQIENSLDHPELAEKWYAQVTEGANYFDAQLQRVMIKVRSGNIPQAVEQLHSIEADEPENRLRMIRIEADIWVQAGDLPAALEVYNRAIEDQEGDTELLYSRAMLAEKMDRLDVLESDLKQIIEAEPDNSQALNALGYTLADRTDRYEEALSYIKRALEVNPKDFYILDSMGWILYRLGRLEESISYLQQAMALKNDPEIAAHLGEVLWVMGDREAAREVWNTALEASPDFNKLKDTIERFIP